MQNANKTRRTIVKEQLMSDELGEIRNLRVSLPPGYSENTAYPAVFCQDGEQFFNFGRIVTFANQMILDGQAEPFLIIGVDVHPKLRTADYSPDGDRFEAYCRFFTEEMFPFIRQKYTRHDDPQRYVVAGDSLGGTVALHLAIEHPALFGNALLLSGALFESTRRRLSEQTTLNPLKIYMLVGTEETAVVTDRGEFNFLEENRKTWKLLEEKQATLHYEEQKGGHIWGFWQQHLPRALQLFFGSKNNA